MRKLLCLSSMLSALYAAPTLAADMPVKARPPAPAAEFSWTGIYVGVNGGYATGQNRETDVPTGAFLDSTPNGGLFGAQVGVNWQWSHLVLGAEADWDWAQVNSSQRCPNVAFQCESALSSLPMVLGRVGFANGQGMFYGTGGPVWFRQEFGAIGVTPATAPFTGFTTRTAQGWIYGIGGQIAPIAAMPNLSFKVELLHYNMNDRSTTWVIGVGAPSNTVFGKLSGEILRVGLNYRLDWSLLRL
jgi:outer membrane immunogenic protein